MRISDWSSDVCSSDLTLGNLAAKARELRRVFQELNDFLQFLTRFINNCDVVKSYFALLFGKQLRLGFTKAHGARSRTLLHLPQNEEGDHKDQKERKRLIKQNNTEKIGSEHVRSTATNE